MIPVHTVVPQALEAILRKAPLTPEKVGFAWRFTVGPAVDRATVVDLREGVLHVRTRDRSWQREIERSAGLIRTRLAALLGENVVRTVHVVVVG